ncbi:hypothetical protein C9I91_05410 [Photobacterium jeanii]|nr:PAAR domain-containing protein [Photobacterium jeanii]PST92611.1 hypothetical protein C9I91_05410 [Photobacterium jeanii]
MGKPAAYIGCHHTCPQYSGKTPHVGGPVAAGSSNVFIGGMPAARQGDRLVCYGGPPDSIASGSSGVFINGKPAARMGDSTSHGGKVVVGNGTVLIGEKSSGPAGGGSTKNSGGTNNNEQKEFESASPDFHEAIVRAVEIETQLVPVCGLQNGGNCTLGDKCKCPR